MNKGDMRKSKLSGSSKLRTSSTNRLNDLRPSISGTQQRMSRMSSMGSTNSRSASCNNKDTMKDPRPINDKAYKDAVVKEMIEFLTTSGYPNPITHKILQSPSNTDFRNIVNFMVKFLPVEGDFQLGPNFEETFPELMAKLSYPVPIPKRMMKTVGVPYQWPQLLLALDFIRSTIVRRRDQDDLPPKVNLKDEFLHHCVNDHYKSFLLEESDWESVFKRFGEQITKNPDLKMKNDAVEEEERRVKEETEMLRVELERNTASLRSKDEGLLKSREQIECCRRKKLLLEDEMVHKKAECDIIEDKFRAEKRKEEELLKEMEGVMDTLKAQESLGFNVHQMLEELERYEEFNRQEEVMISQFTDDFNSINTSVNAQYTQILEMLNEMKREVLKIDLSSKEEELIFTLELNLSNMKDFASEFEILKDILKNRVQTKVMKKKNDLEVMFREADMRMSHDMEEVEKVNGEVTSSDIAISKILKERQELEKRHKMRGDEMKKGLDGLKGILVDGAKKLDGRRQRNLVAKNDLSIRRQEQRSGEEECMKLAQGARQRYEKYIADMESMVKRKRAVYRQYVKRVKGQMDSLFEGSGHGGGGE